MLTLEEITEEIAAGLSAPPRPLKAILFGSFAHGTSREDSDIDLVVILNKEGRRVTVPFHSGRTLHPKVLRNILDDAGLEVETLKDLLQ